MPEKKSESNSFMQLAVIQIGVFATGVLAFLISMAWNNVVEAYTKDQKSEKESLIIYATVMTVFSVLLMTFFAYVASRYANVPATKIIK